MIIIPAVDIKQGKCVRLLQGRMADATLYADDPAAMAVKWESQGAQLIHVVDLDGAFAKSSVNFDSISAILDRVSVPIQVGGGIRDLDTI
ncbi:MAG TPA: HisA/HisF-related TIM barrel protein, partial [Desulfotignum sp.]|nr:HisA/HisF-related TIM barrel protein [Desulfotignum sp.]